VCWHTALLEDVSVTAQVDEASLCSSIQLNMAGNSKNLSSVRFHHHVSKSLMKRQNGTKPKINITQGSAATVRM